jgi:hypothetical protein
LKKPILFNAEPIKTDVTPILVRGPYDVYIGALDEDKIAQYVVIRRDTGVIEFTHEVTAFIEDWLNHFVKDPIAANAALGQLNLNLAN